MTYPDIDLEVLPNGHFELSNFNVGDTYTSTTIAIFAHGKAPCIYEIRKGDIAAPHFCSDADGMAIWTETSLTVDMDYPADIYAVAWAWGDLTQGHQKFSERAVMTRNDLENRVSGRMARKAARQGG